MRFIVRYAGVLAVIALFLLLIAILILAANTATGATRPPAQKPGCMTVNTIAPDAPRGTPALIQVTYCGAGIRTGSWWCTRTADRKRIVLRCRKVSSRPYQR